MARVTVEDCAIRVPNRFDLVMFAAQRARDISSGAPETVERDNDKNPVVALREIADETIDLEDLGEKLIVGLQKQQPHDDLEEDEEAMGVLEEESILVSASPADPNAPASGAPVGAVPEAPVEAPVEATEATADPGAETTDEATAEVTAEVTAEAEQEVPADESGDAEPEPEQTT